ncbi:ABC transporter substrate-binding protein [Ureibacillus chungkukjangi]|uniref:ABC transporter substrate-binding protein n=1 Tax=Ureibacillus chungkukjangi TaxID=1202712 RepID=UPI00203B9965|nr:ABC transporter substrate-binding protein [Ureibacillus chungkukjangi]MCM3389172.1 ABC transporter substrate-binding protein [Ureibacillus chungkukjangi]
MKSLKTLTFLVMMMALFVILAACSETETGGESAGTETQSSSDTTEEVSEETAEVKDVKLVLNWFAKAQHGGVYAAQENGLFEENGLNLTIEPGGPQVSSINMVASGNAEFGLAHADQIVVARNQGIELVAVATAMQGSPQAFMFHKGHGIEDFEDLNGRKVYIQPGITYWEYLKTQYDLSGVEELAYTGQHVNFIPDEEAVTQAFLTSEPYFMELEGVEVETKLIADAGYDPYNVVLYVTKDYLEENEETVRAFTKAFVEGWNLYEDSYEEINKIIQQDNPDIEIESLKFEAESQADFVYGMDAAENGVGYMTEERWATLIQQLNDLKLLDEVFDANEIFTNDYLPE